MFRDARRRAGSIGRVPAVANQRPGEPKRRAGDRYRHFYTLSESAETTSAVPIRIEDHLAVVRLEWVVGWRTLLSERQRHHRARGGTPVRHPPMPQRRLTQEDVSLLHGYPRGQAVPSLQCISPEW